MTRVRIGGEKELLLTFLAQQREVVVWKLEDSLMIRSDSGHTSPAVCTC
jgi:hypothetical protein